MKTDRFGNPFAPGLPYARGAILPDTASDLDKLRVAWGHVRARAEAGGTDAVFNLSGLERQMPAPDMDEAVFDDELAPALYGERLFDLGIDHLGGDPARHDIMLLNRQTAAILAATLTMVRPGDTVIGVSPTYSHPCVVRAAKRAGAVFVDTVGYAAFEAALKDNPSPALVALTRLAVSYDILPEDDLHRIVARAHAVGAKVLLDDAGGARVGPAVFDQPKALALGVDVASTGLDKYGTVGPRLGLLGGEHALVGAIRACAVELGLEARPMLYAPVIRSLEQYTPQRVRDLVESTQAVGRELKSLLGNRVTETPVTAQLHAEDILELAAERAGIATPPLAPYEATAALAMILLRDHGILTVHFAGLPPGTSALLIKFLPPESVERFGGPAALAGAVDDAINRLARVIGDAGAIENLLRDAPGQIAKEG
jgi:L-seryl-tRNA(Ser) seleniumtransferase